MALPPALAAMIDEQRDLEQSRAAVALPKAILSGIRSRAAATGIDISVSDDGRSISATSHSGSVPWHHRLPLARSAGGARHPPTA